ncbi:methyl-accepting chemotaxis protein [Thauera linaloolentis]|uniref:Putative ribose and galactose chemoreceptor protein n=1 Tax=Thauera linaloolentis (strain DSM 12138 / JCM 21573 / CCUG 41526 / CIP 105981 / IAM 15112 / NBRC 102519 / 47Lol) TaxID=1123367 RepID=N6Y949_THAL4|nr:methyl-accepting chemotaxis protein [Thauera linaloolentis]ENO88070.1 putative ribose and galactose chemoreceptor protein [Thauera linaloolentis 47Lol = DSM 12138]MCM8565207.1 methyl-accepting chemotaxis protein [Thauera linaloolentis]
MTWFDSLSLRMKLIFNFIVSSGLLIAAIIICYVQIDRMDRLSSEMSNHTLPSLMQTAAMSEGRMRYRIRSLEFMLAETAADRDKTEKSLVDLDAKLSQSIDDYRRLAADPEAHTLLDAFAKAVGGYRDTVMKAVALVKDGREQEAVQLQRTEWFTAGTQVATTTAALLQHANDEADEERRASAQAASDAKQMAIGALVVGTLVAALVSILLARRITSRLHHAVTVANEIAAGHLGQPAGGTAARSGDEIGRLLGAIDAMRESLRTTIGEARDASARLSASAEDLGKGVSELEASVDAQSTEASNIAASVEEVTVSIGEVASRTNEASAAARESDTKAREGREVLRKLEQAIDQVSAVVRTASEGIGNLAEESKKISAIVNVIKDIADQTNLLALNAAIEAARAGEQGRGFAVVADEVRKLAERTSQSTGEITAMVDTIQQSTGQVVARIDEGVSAVSRSVDHAREAGGSIESLLAIARQVSELISDIDLALREQTEASTVVARSVEQIANSAEQIHTVTTASSRSAESLRAMAAHMQDNVSRFTL